MLIVSQLISTVYSIKYIYSIKMKISNYNFMYLLPSIGEPVPTGQSSHNFKMADFCPQIITTASTTYKAITNM